MVNRMVMILWRYLREFWCRMIFFLFVTDSVWKILHASMLLMKCDRCMFLLSEADPGSFLFCRYLLCFPGLCAHYTSTMGG